MPTSPRLKLKDELSQLTRSDDQVSVINVRLYKTYSNEENGANGSVPGAPVSAYTSETASAGVEL